MITALIFLADIAAAQPRQEYSYGPDEYQNLDVYRPDGAVNAPVIIMLHGGAWRTGDKRSRSVWQSKTDYWLPKGYVFVSVNTRLVPDAGPIAQAQDLATAIAFVQQHAMQFGADPRKVILMGHSAGAHVAALVATDDNIRRQAGVQGLQGTVILDSAALDVVSIMQNNPARLFRRAFGNTPAYWQAASPIRALNGTDGPFLIACSSQRDTACPAAHQFAGAARSTGARAIVMPLDLSHRQINSLLGDPNTYTSTVDRWISAQVGEG